MRAQGECVVEGINKQTETLLTVDANLTKDVCFH